MKRILILLTVFLLSMGAIFAQKTVSGTVTDSRTGEAIEGVAVIAYGTTVGTYTNEDGAYSIDVPASADKLIFRFVGKKTIEQAISGSSMNIGMADDDLQLDEVVVTALGIKREEKSLGYSVQQIDGDKVSAVREQNLASALSGKIAGVQAIGSSGASLGGSARIRIRGANTLDGGGAPLWVVDGTPISDDNSSFSDSYRGSDFGNLAQDINPDDIESVTVLKGPSATALYGNRAAYGVILVTTKKGDKRKGIGISVNSSLAFDNVYLLPEYQNEYGGGYSEDYIDWVDPKDGQTYKTLNYGADESWGPKMDGTQYRPWWSFYDDEFYGTTIPMSAQPNNVQDFFDQGKNLNNSISLSGGNDASSFRLSFNNTQQTGVIPNSSLNRTNVSLNAETKLNSKLTVSTSITVSANAGKGRPKFGYESNGNNQLQSFNQWFQRQLDIDKLRDYRNPDGSLRSWNIRSPENTRPLYWDSPFFSAYENFSTDSRDRYFGNMALNYELNENLSVKGTVRRDWYNQRIEKRIATGGLVQDSYSEQVAQSQEDNYELLAFYNNEFGDITLDANLGGNIRTNDYHSNYMETQSGLSAPNLFNIAASNDRPITTSYIQQRVVRSVFGSASVGFREILYLGATFRNDWSSSLPVDNNSYFYPSVNATFIFSELWENDLSVFSYGKLRLSYAQVGSDLNPYQTAFAYGAGTPYGSSPTFNLPGTFPNTNLEPTRSNSFEAGVDLRFFEGRVGLDVTYYQNTNLNQILALDVPGSSGYSSTWVNAGRIESEGIEFALTATPVRTKSFNWDIAFNLAKNTSTVVELAEGVENKVLGGWGWGGFTINAKVGEEYGMMIGRDFTYFQAEDGEGNPIDNPNNGQTVIREDGSYVVNLNQDLGSFLPDWTGGIRNSFSYKNLELSAFIDFQVGGQFHSVTKMFNAYSGLGIETVGNNAKGNPLRDAPDAGGGILVSGVLEDGTPHEVYVEAQEYFGGLFALHERWIYDASYVKLREVSFGYRLPKKFLASTPINNLSIGLMARNVWLISSAVSGIDPSEISPGSNPYVFQENGILPGVRTIGVNVKLGF